MKLPLKLWAAACLLILAACNSEIKETAPKTKPNVIVILIDTLRADHLGFNGYERQTSPVLDKFASENLNFKYAYSSSAWTPPAVASIFTGVYASVHGHMPLKSEDDERAKGKFSKVDDSFETLAETFTANGYETACISANPMVDPNYGLSQGFKHFYSPGRESAQMVNQRSLKYLKELRDKDKPFLLYMHYMDPHFPYTPVKPYDTLFTGPLKSRSYEPKELKYIGKYDGEVKYVDTKVGEMFDWLKENKLYDDTIILVLADHGEQFMERGHLGHADRLHTEEVHIPFILKAPGKKGEVTYPVSLVDAYPTLLEASGIELKHEINGVSLFNEADKRKEKGILLEIVRHWNQKAFINSKGDKIILEYKMESGLVNPKLEDAEKKSLYNIYKDDWEVKPIDDNALMQKMIEDIKKLYKEVLNLKKNYKTSEIDMDKETYEKLKTLGYL
jgi:arylsulfatase A-like enzyme